MTRARWICLGVLVLLLALVPFVPRGGDDEGAIVPTSRTHHQTHRAHGPALTAGWGRMTAADRRTIDRVVAADRTEGRLSPRMSPAALVDRLVRCVSFEGQRYCLGQGWTDRSAASVQARASAVAARQLARPVRVQNTGDLGLLASLRQQARLSPRALAASQRAELRQAARSVAKVWLLRHQIQGVPLPKGFLARHPEVQPVGGAAPRRTTAKATATTSPTTSPTSAPTTSPTTGPTASEPTGVPTTAITNPTTTPSPGTRHKHWRDYPDKGVVLKPKDVAQQTRTYWCGPTSMQMIAWGWQGHERSQDYWARKLGTTTAGTAITSMVHVVNTSTGWDRKSYAGPYIVLDIGDWSFRKWMLLMARHIVDYRAPVILHPVLLTQFYPYLDHDGSGHYQVGRGYKKRPGKTPLLGYFEPWNQQAFHPDEPFIDRVQWRNAYQSYRANEAHFQHNLGV